MTLLLLLNTVQYVATSFALVAAFIVIYTLCTPTNEIKLIRQGNLTAAFELGGALIGFTLPLAVLISNASGLLDLVAWSGVALVLQLFVFYMMTLLLGHVGRRITDDQAATGVLLGAAAVAGGVINAVCLLP